MIYTRRTPIVGNQMKIATGAVQGGHRPKATEPRIPTLCQSTTYKYDGADHVAKLRLFLSPRGTRRVPMPGP